MDSPKSNQLFFTLRLSVWDLGHGFTTRILSSCLKVRHKLLAQQIPLRLMADIQIVRTGTLSGISGAIMLRANKEDVEVSSMI